MLLHHTIADMPDRQRLGDGHHSIQMIQRIHHRCERQKQLATLFIQLPVEQGAGFRREREQSFIESASCLGRRWQHKREAFLNTSDVIVGHHRSGFYRTSATGELMRRDEQGAP